MPGRDRTGPQGQGPKSGRGLGKCNSRGGTTAPQGQNDMGSGRRSGRRQGQKADRGGMKGGRRGRQK